MREDPEPDPADRERLDEGGGDQDRVMPQTVGDRRASIENLVSSLDSRTDDIEERDFGDISKEVSVVGLSIPPLASDTGNIGRSERIGIFGQQHFG